MYSNHYQIYTDGCCLGNPGAGGIGVHIVFPSGLNIPDEKIFRGFHITTNNRMELRAAILGLKILRDKIKKSGRRQIAWFTDSKYVAENIYNVPKWRRNNEWLRGEGEPVLNVDLWRELEAVRSSLRIYPCWIGRDGNGEADKLAKYGARNPSYTDFGYNPGKVGTSIGKKNNRTPCYYKENKEELQIRIYKGDGQVSSRDPRCKVRFEIISNNGNILPGSHYIYSTPEIYNNLHRHYKYIVKTQEGNITEVVCELGL